MVTRLAEWLELPANAVSALPLDVQRAMWARMEAHIAVKLQEDLVGHLVGVVSAHG